MSIEYAENILFKGGDILYLKKIKDLCETAGITIGKLEKDLGFSNGSIYKWSTSSPSVDRLQRVAEYFDVTLDFFKNDKEANI